MKFHKSESMTIRVTPKTKLALQLASNKERRSMANMVEFLIMNYIDKNELNEMLNQVLLETKNESN